MSMGREPAGKQWEAYREQSTAARSQERGPHEAWSVGQQEEGELVGGVLGRSGARGSGWVMGGVFSCCEMKIGNILTTKYGALNFIAELILATG
ncbi:MAG TPA: hypothetical protein VGN34_00215 [Ktedonobacteraceae bacterium]|jgi:hypothetical protein